MCYNDFFKCCTFIYRYMPQYWDIFLCCDCYDVMFTKALVQAIDKIREQNRILYQKRNQN